MDEELFEHRVALAEHVYSQKELNDSIDSGDFTESDIDQSDSDSDYDPYGYSEHSYSECYHAFSGEGIPDLSKAEKLLMFRNRTNSVDFDTDSENHAKAEWDWKEQIKQVVSFDYDFSDIKIFTCSSREPYHAAYDLTSLNDNYADIRQISNERYHLLDELKYLYELKHHETKSYHSENDFVNGYYYMESHLFHTLTKILPVDIVLYEIFSYYSTGDWAISVKDGTIVSYSNPYNSEKISGKWKDLCNFTRYHINNHAIGIDDTNLYHLIRDKIRLRRSTVAMTNCSIESSKVLGIWRFKTTYKPIVSELVDTIIDELVPQIEVFNGSRCRSCYNVVSKDGCYCGSPHGMTWKFSDTQFSNMIKWSYDINCNIPTEGFLRRQFRNSVVIYDPYK